jgi:hypothetical protein
MIQVSITKDGTLTNQASFATQEEAEAWIAYHNFSGDILIEDIAAKLEQEKINQEALKFLADTDWLVIRKQENGTEIPQDILDARAEARAKIVR